MTPALPLDAPPRERACRLARPSRLYRSLRLHQLARPRRDVACNVSCLSDVRRWSGHHHWSVRRLHRRWNGHLRHLHHRSARHRHWAHSNDRRLRIHHLRNRRVTRHSWEQRCDHHRRIHHNSGANIRHRTDCVRSVVSYPVADGTNLSPIHRRLGRSHASENWVQSDSSSCRCFRVPNMRLTG